MSSRVDNTSCLPQVIVEALPVVKKGVEKVTNIASKVAGTARSVVGFVGTQMKVPAHVSAGFSATKLLAGLSTLFAIPEFISKIKKIFTASTVAKSERALLKSTVSGASIVQGVGSFMQGLQAVGAICKNATAWVSKAAPYLFPFQVIGTLFDIHTLYRTYKFSSEMNAKMKEEGEVKGLCNFLASQKAKHITKLTSFDGKDVQEKANEILQKLEKKQEISEEDTKFVEQMKGRVKKMSVLNTITTVLSIVGIAASIFLLVAGASNPIGAGILAAISVIGLGIFFYKMAMSGKQGEPSLPEKIASAVSGFFKSVAAKIQSACC